MKQFLMIAVALIMFFTAGIQLDFSDDVEMPEWVEKLISENKGSMVNMTNSPIYKIARSRLAPMSDELSPPSVR